MYSSFHIKRSVDENQEQDVYEYTDDFSVPEKMSSKSPRPKQKASKFHNPKTTRAQVLKERKTQDLLTERKLKEQKEKLEIEIRQEKIRVEQQRIKPTLKRIRYTMSSMNLLTKKDEIKSIEKRYKEWLLLKDQEHNLKQTMLAKLSGDFTTFSIEKALSHVRELDRLEAEKDEDQPHSQVQSVAQSQAQSQENDDN